MGTIEIGNLKKYFGAIKAVDDISLSVNDGEIFGFLGPNGAGKTTTIACMMGFLRPTAGTITINGKDATKERTFLKNEIGFLSSDVHLYKELTGMTHVQLVEGIRGKSELLPKLLYDFSFDLNQKAANLSTGTKQKLGIIMCFMNKPKILLLDEPTRGLDPLLQNKVYEYILDAKKNGTTIFMSSHNLSEVERLCDRVGIIKSGKLVEVETLATLRGKQISVVKAYFKERPSLKAIKIDGIENIQPFGSNGVTFTLKGEIGPVLKFLDGNQLIDLEIAHASLEEIFMEYYK
jgi:ABC-2 type transport system ATP-binding protein